jgi:hypothetical protein
MTDSIDQTEDLKAILAKLGDFHASQLREAFPWIRPSYASKGDTRPEPEPRPDPPAGLSPEELVVHWIDELLATIEYLKAIELAFAKFGRPRPYKHGFFLTISDCNLPARWRERYQPDAHDPTRIRAEVDATSVALAEAIRATSPGSDSAKFIRFEDPRDGRVWVSLPDNCQIDSERITHDLIDLEDNPIAWSAWISAIAVFAPGQPVRFEATSIYPAEGLAFEIDEAGTATLVEGDVVDDDAGDVDAGDDED